MRAFRPQPRDVELSTATQILFDETDTNGLYRAARLRGVDSFAKLWRRRTVIELPDKTTCELLSLPDLVQAKKTQRDKDWPMVRRLVEAHYFQHAETPTPARVRFWLRELRTPQLLTEVAQAHPRICRELVPDRPLLALPLAGRTAGLERALLRRKLPRARGTGGTGGLCSENWKG